MSCKAVVRTFAGAPRDGSLLDADWRCRVCSKLPAEHTGGEEVGAATSLGQKLDSGIHDLRKIGQLFKKPSITKTSAPAVIHVHKPEVEGKKTAAAANDRTAAATIAESPMSSVKLSKVMRMLQEPNMDMEALRSTSWSGIPFEVRGTVWQLLLGYLPANRARRRDTLERRRAEYHGYVRQFYEIPDSARSAEELDILRQIEKDTPRTTPTISWVHDDKFQKSLERMLYIWAIRHPASGYVQGINDLAIPFYLVFLSTSTGKPVNAEFDSDVASLPSMSDLEADCYWCLSMLLDSIQDSYTFAQPGIQRMVYKLEELIQRIDAPLHEHLKKQGIMFIHFAFRWMNCLLMREMALPLVVRLWDTYLSELSFKVFHIYVCAAFLEMFAKPLKKLEFQEIVLYLQTPPTTEWSIKHIETLLSQAFVLQSQYENSPAQLK